MYEAKGYSHAIRKGGMLFIAGQVALDRQKNLVGRGDISAQAEQAFLNLERVVKAAGASLADIVKLTMYTTSIAFYRPQITEVRDRYFPVDPPANTFVVVSSFSNPDLLFEVDAIAVLD
jgi:enamine deaminase RidA (YjgF/YER057c/UK114 family)